MADLAALLDKEAGAEIEAILSEARERASEIVAEAEREAETLRATRERQAKSQREAQLVRTRSAAQLEAASTRLHAQQKAIESVFGAVADKIEALTQDASRYGTVLEALIREAADALPAAPTTIRVHPDDVEVASAAAKAVGVDAPVEGDATVRAGVKVTSGRMSIENSLPARLDALRDELASEVADALTSKES